MPEDKILDRVSHLLERANHKDANPNERDACLKKADELMMRHQISQAMLAGRTAGQRASEPIVASMVFVHDDDEFFPELTRVISVFARLCKVRPIVMMSRSEIRVVGFPDDIEYFRMLWTGAFMVFSNKLSPRWDNSQTLAWNIRAQKEAGVKWPVIWDLAKSNGWSGYRAPGKVDVYAPVIGLYSSENFKAGEVAHDITNKLPISVGRCPKDGGYFKRLYEKQCELDGVPATNHTQRNAAYRASYAIGFLNEIQDRVLEMENIRGQYVAKTGGAEVALRDHGQIVSEFFRNLFPNSESISTPIRHGTEEAGVAAGHLAGKNVDLLGGRNRMGGTKRELEA